MASREVGALLEECLRAAAAGAAGPHQHTQTGGLNFSSCKDSLPLELTSLLREAEEMRWPFVPEKWQYKDSLSAGDKTNLSDLIGRHLTQLLDFLKVSIASREVRAALAVAFLLDRFLYWTDESGRLLKVVRLLHRRHPDAPVAPQLVIRQARLYLNSGKLQKAEFILSSLINSSGATGCWVYRSESDRALVQAVSVQVRGLILQKLGLWLQAAELVWASLVGYYALPQPDKKGIGTSLGILANILMSMNDQDYQAFKTHPDIDLSLLGEGGHRLLSAAEAARMAVVYSQYASLYVLTNVVIEGTCLLSYSFSVDCPPSRQRSFLLRARDAFAIGLLTKAEGELVASQQELHALLKAAYSLAVAHKWLGAPADAVAQATRACREALVQFYGYCRAAAPDKDGCGVQVMRRIGRVASVFQVEPFPNSDAGSFIPDSYRDVRDTSLHFTLEGFSKLMQRFQKHHASACQTPHATCKAAKDGVDGAGACVTALMTTAAAECATEVGEVSEGAADSSGFHQRPTESCEDLESSWGKLPSMESRFPPPQNKKQSSPVNRCFSSRPAPRSTTPSTSSSGDSAKFELLQADVETADGEGGDLEDSPCSLSQLELRTPSSSLGDSFGSGSSWVKVSGEVSGEVGSPTPSQHQRTSLAQTHPSNRSSDSTGSFFHMETEASSDWESDPPHTLPTPGGGAAKPRPDPPLAQSPTHSRSAPEGDDTSLTSSFEMLGVDESGDPGDGEPGRNPRCHSCLRPDANGFTPATQYFLSQQDYRSLLAGICHRCLMRRLHNDEKLFKLEQQQEARSALHLKFSKATGVWTARETCVYVGPGLEKEGKQRTTMWVQFLHQEERLSSYVGKEYKEPKGIQLHLKDVERQMTAQHYVAQFNKRLYDREVMTQIFFIPSEALLILDGDEIVGCVSVEPYMLGQFVKLTNNTWKKDRTLGATDYGLAFGHFTYLLSGRQEVVVDLQGWVTADGKGLTYLTDPQIHSTRTPRGPANFAQRGIQLFLKEQHGPECNTICHLLNLPPVTSPPNTEAKNIEKREG